MVRKSRSPQDRREGRSPSGHRAADQRGPQTGPPNRRARPDAPDGWRSLMSSDYDYPDEMNELDSRERRRARKNWRRDDHAQRMAWLRDQRRAEPTSPVALVVLVV